MLRHETLLVETASPSHLNNITSNRSQLTDNLDEIHDEVSDSFPPGSPPKKRQCPLLRQTKQLSSVPPPPVINMHVSNKLSPDCVVTSVIQAVLRKLGERMPCKPPACYEDFPRDLKIYIYYSMGAWLEDAYTDKAQALLCALFPKMGGFQSVGYLAMGSGGSVTGSPIRDYSQILKS